MRCGRSAGLASTSELRRDSTAAEAKRRDIRCTEDPRRSSEGDGCEPEPSYQQGDAETTLRAVLGAGELGEAHPESTTEGP